MPLPVGERRGVDAGARYIGPVQQGTVENRALQPAEAQAGFHEDDRHGAVLADRQGAQIGATKIGLVQQGAVQARASQVGAAEVAAAQVGPFQTGALEADSPKVHTGKAGVAGAEAGQAQAFQAIAERTQVLAVEFQQALEHRIAQLTIEQQEWYERQRAEDLQRWLALEQQWREREATAEVERARLAAERDAAMRGPAKTPEEIEKNLRDRAALLAEKDRVHAEKDIERAALLSEKEENARLKIERDRLLTEHAQALEAGRVHAEELHFENCRLHAQLSTMERELRQTEHETRLQTMEAEEAVEGRLEEDMWVVLMG